MESSELWRNITSGDRLVVIAGPCVIESEDLTMKIAEECRKISEDLDILYLFKASFDKANRTSIHSFRGPGIDQGLKILEKVKSELGLPIVTDIHEPSHVEKTSSIVDVIQIPAFLCRQTDLLVAAAQSTSIINVKKGQFLAPWDMKSVVQKIEESGGEKLMLTERGSSFGYNNLVADMRSIPVMSQFGYPIIFDATHSVQLPGGGGDKSAGNGEYAPVLACAAVAAGCNGVFIETHPDPSKALSDGPNMIPLNELKKHLSKMVSHYQVAHTQS